MKDKTARVLAIVALVFMGLFIVALIATFVDFTLFNGGIGFIALGLGVIVLIILIALKADGRGFSMTKINNEIELEKIEKELAEKENAKSEQEKTEDSSDGDGESGVEEKQENN